MAEPERRRVLLVVDDTDLDVEYITRRMQRLGLTNATLRARNGEEALALLAAHRGDRIAMLLDLNMPPLSGREVLDDLAGQPDLAPEVTIVVSTSDRAADVSLREHPFVTGYEVKPLGDDVLCELLA